MVKGALRRTRDLSFMCSVLVIAPANGLLAQGGLQTHGMTVTAPSVRRPVHASGAVVTAAELPLVPQRCDIAVDGYANTDWTVTPCNFVMTTFTIGGSPSISQGGIAVSHWSHPTAGGNVAIPDTLYLYLGVTGDGTNDLVDDNLVVMVDKNHDASLVTGNERGIRFRRDKSADSVGGDPSNPVSLGSFCGPPCQAAQRAYIITVGQDWSIEAKLIPSDFGMNSFAGTVGIVIALRDKNAATPVVYWPNGASDAPTSWGDLKLGNPIDLMLVLDLSGSMGDPTCNPAPCEPKLNKLKAAADLLVGLFNAVASPADQIGVRYFSTNASAFPVPPPPLVPVLNNASTIKLSIDAQGPGGWTAMGAGLQWAINDLPATGRSRAIVLFTDGMQNVDPMVHDDGAGNLSIQNEGLSLVSNVPPENPATALNTMLGINVNTVGMGASTDAFTQRLNDIATKTGGNYDATTDPNQLQALFVTQLTYALRSHSPQLLAYRLGTVSNRTATEIFTANNSARKLVFAVTWPRGDSLIFRVEKDGVDVTRAGLMVATDLYRILTLPLPTRVQNTVINSGGDWRVTIQGPNGIPYQAMALIDEPLLEYEVSFEDRDYVVGDALRLRARVMYAGQPVTNARVTATILKPKLSIGTLLSRTVAIAAPHPQPRPDTTAAQVKLQRLLADSMVRASLQPSTQDVVLTGHGDGMYTAAVVGTGIAGPYTAHFQVEGSRPDIGSYRRVQTASRVVRFGKADVVASAVHVTRVGVTPDGRRLILYLRPTDGTNYLGPEYGPRINISLSAGTVGPATDLLDGGYTFPLLVPRGTDPVITVTILGERFYRGPLSKFESPPNAFSLHAGISLPHGNFKNAYKNGFGATADFEHHLSGMFSLAVLLGYHRFETVTTGAHLDLYHLSGSLEAFLTPGPLVVFIDAGSGVYRLNPGATKSGAHAGVNVEYEVSPSLLLGGSYRLHTVFTSGANTTFSSVQGGGRFKF